jgi:hypothetical protein
VLIGISRCGSYRYWTGERAGEVKEGEVEIPYLLTTPSNIFNQKTIAGLTIQISYFILYISLYYIDFPKTL